MVIALVVILAACWLGVWLAFETSKPLKPAAIIGKTQVCFDCHKPLTDYWYSVMRCDKCLLAYINRMDSGELKVDDALSVAELEKIWLLTK